MDIRDLAKKEHWDDHYGECKITSKKNWAPKDYNSLVIVQILINQIIHSNPMFILEIGYGDSTWLPYLGKITGKKVHNLSYGNRIYDNNHTISELKV